MTTGYLSPLPVLKFFDNNGNPLAFGFLYTYAAGTTTPLATYTDSTLTTPQTNPIALNFRGECSVWMAPNTPYKFNVTDNAGNQIAGWPVDQIQDPLFAPTQSSIGALLYPTGAPGGEQGLAETTAGVTVVNPWYPYMYVDRYGTNTVPGTTDMSSAFTAAFAVARVNGGRIRYGATAPYGTSNPINASNVGSALQYGITVVNETGPAANASNAPSIIANHTGHVFDMAGSAFMSFENVSIGNGSAVPKTAFFQSRTSGANSVGLTRFLNCAVVGSFSVACYYNYGAEDDQLVGCYWHNTNGGGVKCLVFTGNNIFNLSSTFQTITTGAQSCIDHKIFGGEIYTQSANAAADCIHIEASDSVKVIGPWMLCASLAAAGRSLIFVDGTNSASNWLTVIGVTGETGTFIHDYGIFVSNNAFTHTGWCVSGSKLTNALFAIAGGSLPIIDSANIQLPPVGVVGSGMSFPGGTIQNSIIDFADNGCTIGTSSFNSLTGDTSRLTITTRNKDSWNEMGSPNRTWTPVLSTGWSTVGSVTKRGICNYIGGSFTFSMIVASSTTTAWTNSPAIVTGLPATAVDTVPVTVFDQTAGTVIGMGYMNGNVITLPFAQTASSHTFLISGTFPCS